MLACLSVLPISKSAFAQIQPDGSSADNAIAVERGEPLWHLKGAWPQIRLRADQVTRDWPDGTEIGFDLTVSREGDVISETALPLQAKESHSDVGRDAEELVRKLHFTPFVRDGRAIYVRFTMEIPILPPERRPTVHVSFPELSERKTLMMPLRKVQCLGYCPDYEIHVYGDGRIDYEGHCAVAVVCRRTSRVERAKVDALVEQFKEADFFSLDASYGPIAIDAPWTEIAISMNGQRKNLRETYGLEDGMPETVRRLEDAIDTLSDSRRWIIGNFSSYLAAAKSHPCR